MFCEGEKLVKELVEYREDSIVQIYATDEWVRSNSFHHPKLERVSTSEIERMSGLVISPEVLALVRCFESSDFQLHEGLNVYLDGISDPGNMGTIMRTCEWYGLKSLFISPSSVDIYNPKVVQASMGSLFRLKVIAIDFEELMSAGQFTKIWAAVMNGNSLKNCQVQGMSLLVLGSESHGVSSSILSRCTDFVTIANRGLGESLNVSVAAGIILNEFLGE